MNRHKKAPGAAGGKQLLFLPGAGDYQLVGKPLAEREKLLLFQESRFIRDGVNNPPSGDRNEGKVAPVIILTGPLRLVLEELRVRHGPERLIASDKELPEVPDIRVAQNYATLPENVNDVEGHSDPLTVLAPGIDIPGHKDTVATDDAAGSVESHPIGGAALNMAVSIGLPEERPSGVEKEGLVPATSFAVALPAGFQDISFHSGMADDLFARPATLVGVIVDDPRANAVSPILVGENRGDRRQNLLAVADNRR